MMMMRGRQQGQVLYGRNQKREMNEFVELKEKKRAGYDWE